MSSRNESIVMNTENSNPSPANRREAAIDWAFRGLIVGLSVLWLVTLGLSAARGIDTAALAEVVDRI